jgi:hypothetical protein
LDSNIPVIDDSSANHTIVSKPTMYNTVTSGMKR